MWSCQWVMAISCKWGGATPPRNFSQRKWPLPHLETARATTSFRGTPASYSIRNEIQLPCIRNGSSGLFSFWEAWILAIDARDCAFCSAVRRFAIKENRCVDRGRASEPTSCSLSILVGCPLVSLLNSARIYGWNQCTVLPENTPECPIHVLD